MSSISKTFQLLAGQLGERYVALTEAEDFADEHRIWYDVTLAEWVIGRPVPAL
jgi:hypothetical protein